MEKVETSVLEKSVEVSHHDLHGLRPSIARSASLLLDVFARGRKVLACGNGASATDADRFVGAVSKRFHERRPVDADFAACYAKLFGPNHAILDSLEGGFPAVSLPAQTAQLTALANDLGYEFAFAQQVYALAREGDLLLAISTSGNSSNIVHAARVAKARGAYVIALTGYGGGKLAELADVLLAVPETRGSHVQELHVCVLNTLCRTLERAAQAHDRLVAM